MTLAHDIQVYHRIKKRDLPINSQKKIFFSFLTLFILVSFQDLFPIFLVFLLMTSLISWTGVEFKSLLKTLSVPIAFLIPSIVIIFFIKGTTPFFSLKIFSFKFVIFKEGLILGGVLLARAMAGVTCLYFLVFTTPIEDIIQSLRKIRVPEILIELLFLSYKLIFEIADKTERMKKSIDCRLGFNSKRNKIKSLALLLSSLFVDSINRSVKIDKAMKARGYRGKIPNTKFLFDNKKKKESNLVFYALIGFDVFLITLNLV